MKIAFLSIRQMKNKIIKANDKYKRKMKIHKTSNEWHTVFTRVLLYYIQNEPYVEYVHICPCVKLRLVNLLELSVKCAHTYDCVVIH